MHIKRKLETKILKYLNDREILAILGPRQSGKTTLIKKIHHGLEDSIYLTFEDIEVLALFEEDIKGFIERYKNYKYIFIDEFQYSKSGGKNLKFIYDTYSNLKIIISGSSAMDLSIKAIKYLVGRVFVFELYQIDFDEFLSFKNEDLYVIYKNIKNKFNLQKGIFEKFELHLSVQKEFLNLFEEFVIYGCYPRVIIEKDKEKKRTIIQNIYNTYFLRDVKDFLGIMDDFKLNKLIKLLALNIGNLIEYKHIGDESSYDFITLKRYLNFLEKTFIACFVKPYFVNKKKELIKNPKVYFFDLGLRNYIINDFNILENRVDKGFILENFIFNEFIKNNIKVNFWRTVSKIEVDFITESNNTILPIESKFHLSKPQVPDSLKSFIQEYNPKNAIVFNQSIIDKIKLNETEVCFVPHFVI